ncbi:unnamed protein product [Caenorhabditis auriculariae]|uniref:Uncharacterized protein n=1 Tax=Caenorhabditis auriculariae TaxID=2777116 RepID=A0A8S1HS19_9PELO|nr:unnamed protein product [Caenorhabditis auriculariae]
MDPQWTRSKGQEIIMQSLKIFISIVSDPNSSIPQLANERELEDLVPVASQRDLLDECVRLFRFIYEENLNKQGEMRTLKIWGKSREFGIENHDDAIGNFSSTRSAHTLASLVAGFSECSCKMSVLKLVF